MAKKNWWTGENIIWSNSPDEVKTQTIEDPYKTAVSSPLSSYLSKQIGVGLPRYTEDSLSDPNNPLNRYSSFLTLDAGDWFDKAVAEPEMARFKSEILPEVREGWAGSLRGSGRFRDEEDYATDFASELSSQRYKAVAEIPQQQFAIRQQIYQTEYADWYKSLPEMNPALDKAISYLGGPSGLDTLAYTQKNPFMSLSELILGTAKVVASAAMFAA